MRANGKRAGEWPDDEYANRQAAMARTKPAGDAGSGKSANQAATVAGKADAAPETLKMDLGDD